MSAALRRDPGRLLDDLARGPLDARAARDGRALLEELATLPRADAAAVTLLTRHAALFSALGLDGEVLAVARAWLGRGVVHPDLARIAATCALVATPKAVELRLRDVATDEADALRTLRAFMRGDLEEAASAARRHAFFVAHDDLPFAYATAYAAWALALSGRADEGSLVLSSWRERHPDAPPRATQFVLRAFAWLAGLAHDHHAALDLVGQALALCEESGLAVERAFVEVELALVSRDAGDVEGARQIVAGWDAGTEPTAGTPRTGLLAGYRDLARAQLALEERDAASARAAAVRARAYFERCENVVLACDAQLALCLAEAEAEVETARASLATYRREARRTGVPHHVRDARVLEEVLPRAGAPRAVRLATRDGARRAPLVRLVRPGADAVASDLYVDTVRGEVWTSGRGPFVLGEHPVVERMLEVLAMAGPAGLPLDELFTRVWGASYHPLRHENKVHVTLHRLRQWLDARGGPAAGELVVLARGVVCLDPSADVRVLSFEEGGGFAGRTASRTLRGHEARSSLGARGRRHGGLRGRGLQGQGPEERRGSEGERPVARAAGREGRG